MWKENTLKDLEEGLLEYEIAREFLVDIRKKFGRGDKKSVKMTVSQNELLTYLWYLNLGCTLRVQQW